MEGEEVVKRRKNMEEEGDEKEVVKRMKIMEGEEGSQQPQLVLADNDSDLLRLIDTLNAEAEEASIRFKSWLAERLEERLKIRIEKVEKAMGRPISSLPLDIQELLRSCQFYMEIKIQQQLVLICQRLEKRLEKLVFLLKDKRISKMWSYINSG